MPVRLFGHTCAKCGADHTKASAWAEKGGEYYCHRRPCLREAGVPSAQLKRQRKEQPRAAPAVGERPAGGVLVEVKEVLGQRFVDEAGLEDWQFCNEIAEEDEEVEFLVQAKFSRHERDEHGVVTICWMTVEEMVSGDAEAEDVKGMLQDYSKRCAGAVKEAARACE